MRFEKAPIYAIFFLTFFSFCNKKEGGIPEKSESPLPPRTVVILGSSTAEGAGASPRDSSWVNRLKSQLIAEGKTVNIVNLAKSGFTTFNILPSGYNGADTARNITKALSYYPDFIIINLPSNDIANGYSDSVIMKNFEIVTRSISGAGVEYCLTSTQPRDFPNVEVRRRLPELNQKLKAVYSVRLLDIYSKLVGTNYFINPMYGSGDGAHLNNKGHKVIFESVLSDSLCKANTYR